ncbi:HlyD family efflux transporter periplasmic adaptor subunit [Neptuniibacter sp. QD37_6]|uniref:HlyD family efflux transporter periplasmic adaptor subunit n=1 Tax=Neptuniibacter sp. QD37_6 TaxID=3398210 RepID=UPI0039F4660A
MKQVTDLPTLREELSVFPGPDSAQGSPTWSVYDPARNLYFSLDWPTFEVLCRWSLGNAEDICRLVNSETTLCLSEGDIEEVRQFLINHELVRSVSVSDSQRLCRQQESREQSWYHRLLHSYLFFRIPLWNPDYWLETSLSRIKWIGSRGFYFLTLVALFVGLIQVVRQWDSFSTTLLDLFSIQGLLAYSVTLVAVKFIHELGHAYTAKHFGCKVPTMGIAFLVMFPMAYTDVNDVWKLRSRKQRLYVGGAGILIEVCLAAWATLIWSVLPDGALKTAAFIIATTTWVSTLVINLSPFLRFDGYFLLMDWLEYPNLHARSFNLARWNLREKLFSFHDPIPEHTLPNRQRFLMLFAYGTWLYRFVVFSGIAVLVYLMFPKPLGPLLAGIEIYWFILKPIWSEVSIWIERRRDILRSKRSPWLLGLLVGLMLILFIPWDSRIHTQGVLKPAVTHYLTVTDAVQIKDIYVTSGGEVSQGQLIAELSAPDLIVELEVAQEKARRLRWQISSGSTKQELRSELPILKAQLEQINIEIEGLRKRVGILSLTADLSGELHWYDLDLKAGDWLEARSRIGQIDAVKDFQVSAYIGQEDLGRLSVGDRALFVSESGVIEPVPLIVTRIDRDSTRVLKDEILASAFGGDILVREKGQQLIPEHTIYQLMLKPYGNTGFSSEFSFLKGRVVIQAESQSWFEPFGERFMATLRREAGF